MMERVEGKPLAALGLPIDRLAPGSIARGALFGGALIGLVVLVMAATGAVSWTRDPASAGRMLAASAEFTAFLAVAAFAEELLLRGYPLQLLAEAMGGTAAVLVTAVLFAALHGLNPHVSVLAMVNIALAGVLLGAALLRTMSLWFASGLHFGWNWAMGVAADLPVSGLDESTPGLSLDTPGIRAVVDGAPWITGGPFGPEASWLVTAATVVGIAWIVTTKKIRPALRVLALRPPSLRRELRRNEASGRESG